MALSTANVNTSTDSFQNWIDKTNILLDAYSTTIVTTAANTGGGTTVGNAVINGTFRANTLVAGENLRGGNVTTSGVLSISSNVSIGNSTVNTVFSTTTIDTDLALTVGGAATLSGTLLVSGVATLAGNTILSGTSHTIAGNSSFDSGVLFVDGTNNRVGVNDNTPSVALDVTGDINVTATANVQGNANVGGTFGVTGITTLAANVNIGGVATVSNNFSVTGDSRHSGDRFVVTTSGVSVNSVATFTANATFQQQVVSQSNTLTINVATFITSSNGDLGSNTTSPLLVMSVPKATYKGGELIVSITKSTKSQISKLLFVHDSSDVEMTAYGTIMTPALDPDLGTITAGINNANVEIKIQQSTGNTAVKMMATLF